MFNYQTATIRNHTETMWACASHVTYHVTRSCDYVKLRLQELADDRERQTWPWTAVADAYIHGVVIYGTVSEQTAMLRDYFRNTTLHYGTGVSVGVLASLLILLFILTRFLPSKLKTLGYGLMLVGTSASLWLLSSITKLLSEPVAETVIQYWQYVLGYCVVMGVLSFAVVYRYGPVSDERTLNLIQWLLQIIGLILIYNSTQIREVSAALVILVVTVYNIPRTLVFHNQWLKNWWHRFFPPKIKLLSEDEYVRQGNIETKRELEKLREYCRSPNCDAWRIISKLKSPVRFAAFVEGSSRHITDEELLNYDSGQDANPVLDTDEESEMDFILGSQ